MDAQGHNAIALLPKAANSDEIVPLSGTIEAIDALNISESSNIRVGNVITIENSIQINQYIVEEKRVPHKKPQKKKKEKTFEENIAQDSYDTDDDDEFIHVSPYDNIIPGFHVVTKLEWKARRIVPELEERFEAPVPYVIIAHTATDIFYKKIDNVYHLRYLQDYHMNHKKWSDISYNFLVGGDGSVFEGRGWDIIGKHSKEFNAKSICVAFVGTFCLMTPPQAQIDAARKLIEICHAAGKIDKNYKLIGHRQTYETLSPGDRLFAEIKKWPHFCENID